MATNPALWEIEDKCRDCGTPVGGVDLGDVDGAAAMTWEDFDEILKGV